MINIKTQELNDIVCEQNHEHHRLLTNEDTKDEYDGHKPHLHESFQ
jgi:hypothetical protein